MTKKEANNWKKDIRSIKPVNFGLGPVLTIEKECLINLIDGILSQEKEKWVEEIKKIEMPEYQNEGAEHANAGYVRAVEDIINLLQNK